MSPAPHMRGLSWCECDRALSRMLVVAPCLSSNIGRRNRGEKPSPGDTKSRGGRVSRGTQGHGEAMLLSL